MSRGCDRRQTAGDHATSLLRSGTRSFVSQATRRLFVDVSDRGRVTRLGVDKTNEIRTAKYTISRAV